MGTLERAGLRRVRRRDSGSLERLIDGTDDRLQRARLFLGRRWALARWGRFGLGRPVLRVVATLVMVVRAVGTKQLTTFQYLKILRAEEERQIGSLNS